MAQRLNIEIYKNGQVLANAYYHWGAFTNRALDYVKEIIEAYQTLEFKSLMDSEEIAIRILEATGATLMPNEHVRAMKRLKPDRPFQEGYDRDGGLIAFTKREMSKIRRAEEARIELHLDTQAVKFGVYDTCEKTEVTAQQWSLIPISGVRLEQFTFGEISSIRRWVYQLIEQEMYHYRLPSDTIVQLVA